MFGLVLNAPPFFRSVYGSTTHCASVCVLFLNRKQNSLLYNQPSRDRRLNTRKNKQIDSQADWQWQVDATDGYIGLRWSKYVPWSSVTNGLFSHQFADGRAALISFNFHVVSLGNSMGWPELKVGCQSCSPHSTGLAVTRSRVVACHASGDESFGENFIDQDRYG